MKIKLFLLTFVFSLCTLGSFAGANDDLFASCKKGDLEGVKKAITEGAEVNALDAAGNPALTYAFFWPDIVKYLLDNKADPNLGNSPVLYQSAVYSSVEVMKLVLDAGADPNKPTISDPSASFKSLIETEKKKGKDGNKDLIKAWEGLLKTSKPTESYILPILVMSTNCASCLQMMLEKGAKLDKGSTDGSLLHTLAGFGKSKEDRKSTCVAAKPVIEGYGIKVPDWYANLPDDRNGTPDDMVKILLSKGLSISEKNKGAGGIPPQTPLEVSLGGGMLNKPDVTLALIANGGDVKIVSDWYGPVIIQAALLGSVDVLKAMIDKGADINTKGRPFTDSKEGSKDFTPLNCAAMKNQFAAVKFLLEKGASTVGISGTVSNGLCPANVENKSAIYFAIENKNMEMVKYIVEHGAFNGKNLDYSAKRMTNCIGGSTYKPSAYAKALDLPELADYLKKQGI